MKKLQAIQGVTLVEPQGAFYCLPVMTSFFGPSANAHGFGAIPDADTLSSSNPVSQTKLTVVIVTNGTSSVGKGHDKLLTSCVAHPTGFYMPATLSISAGPVDSSSV